MHFLGLLFAVIHIIHGQWNLQISEKAFKILLENFLKQEVTFTHLNVNSFLNISCQSYSLIHIQNIEFQSVSLKDFVIREVKINFINQSIRISLHFKMMNCKAQYFINQLNNPESIFEEASFIFNELKISAIFNLTNQSFQIISLNYRRLDTTLNCQKKEDSLQSQAIQKEVQYTYREMCLKEMIHFFQKEFTSIFEKAKLNIFVRQLKLDQPTIKNKILCFYNCDYNLTNTQLALITLSAKDILDDYQEQVFSFLNKKLNIQDLNDETQITTYQMLNIFNNLKSNKKADIVIQMQTLKEDIYTILIDHHIQTIATLQIKIFLLSNKTENFYTEFKGNVSFNSFFSHSTIGFIHYIQNTTINYPDQIEGINIEELVLFSSISQKYIESLLNHHFLNTVYPFDNTQLKYFQKEIKMIEIDSTDGFRLILQQNENYFY